MTHSSQAGLASIRGAMGALIAAPVHRIAGHEEAVVRLQAIADTDTIRALTELVLVGMRADQIRTLAATYQAHSPHDGHSS